MRKYNLQALTIMILGLYKEVEVKEKKNRKQHEKSFCIERVQNTRFTFVVNKIYNLSGCVLKI